ncbi:hypothetical protein OTU49_011288, partial [Cherax quadricarinatus]
PRFLDPMLFAHSDTGGALEAGVMNTLLRTTNLTKGASPGSSGPSYLDYNNPILVHELPSFISTTPRATTRKPTTTMPFTLSPILALASVTTSKAQTASSSSIHTVTGDTPTIYAGSSGIKRPDQRPQT